MSEITDCIFDPCLEDKRKTFKFNFHTIILTPDRSLLCTNEDGVIELYIIVYCCACL